MVGWCWVGVGVGLVGWWVDKTLNWWFGGVVMLPFESDKAGGTEDLGANGQLTHNVHNTHSEVQWLGQHQTHLVPHLRGR